MLLPIWAFIWLYPFKHFNFFFCLYYLYAFLWNPLYRMTSSKKQIIKKKKNPAKYVKYLLLLIFRVSLQNWVVFICSAVALRFPMLVSIIQGTHTPCNLSKQGKGLKVRPGHEEANNILERSCGKYYAMHSSVNTINYAVDRTCMLLHIIKIGSNNIWYLVIRVYQKDSNTIPVSLLFLYIRYKQMK